MTERRTINVRVSPKSAAGWTAFSNNTGASLSAIIEAIGRYLDSIEGDPNQLTDVAVDMVNEARSIDAERRRRPR